MNPIEKAYTWYKYNISIVNDALKKHSNGLHVNENEFMELKRFVFSKSLLDTYNMEWNNNKHYTYILHHSHRLFNETFNVSV